MHTPCGGRGGASVAFKRMAGFQSPCFFAVIWSIASDQLLLQPCDGTLLITPSTFGALENGDVNVKNHLTRKRKSSSRLFSCLC